MKDEDTYTEAGMIRKRGGKVLYELEWQNVEKIEYSEWSLLMFAHDPTALVIYQTEPPKDKTQERIFIARYSTEDVMKIQAIIPLEIDGL